MRILIYGINYPPELTGIGKFTGEMASWLASNGHVVKVITGMPYYPEWEIHKNYKKRIWHKEKLEGVTVYRCPLYVPRKLTALKRIIHEFSFIAAVLPIWFKTLLQKKFDTVISISPPLLLGFLPLLYCKLRGVNLISHIQDLQVDSAKNLAMLKNGTLLHMMFAAEKFILSHSRAISTISTGMLNRIKEKNLTKAKTILFPNWANDQTIRPLAKEESLRKELGLSMTDQIVLYSGNLGEKQGLDIIVDVAKEFINISNVLFLIVGTGGSKEKLETSAAENRLTNILFYPLVPKEKLSRLLAAADVHLVLQKKSAADLMMPSKLMNILSAGGCPIVTAAPGTSLYELIEQNKLGFTVKPESAQGLKMCIEKTLRSDLDQYRTNARDYATTFLSKESIMRNFEKELNNLLDARKKSILIYEPFEKTSVRVTKYKKIRTTS